MNLVFSLGQEAVTQGFFSSHLSFLRLDKYTNTLLTKKELYTKQFKKRTTAIQSLIQFPFFFLKRRHALKNKYKTFRKRPNKLFIYKRPKARKTVRKKKFEHLHNKISSRSKPKLNFLTKASKKSKTKTNKKPKIKAKGKEKLNYKWKQKFLIKKKAKPKKIFSPYSNELHISKKRKIFHFSTIHFTRKRKKLIKILRKRKKAIKIYKKYKRFDITPDEKLQYVSENNVIILNKRIPYFFYRKNYTYARRVYRERKIIKLKKSKQIFKKFKYYLKPKKANRYKKLYTRISRRNGYRSFLKYEKKIFKFVKRLKKKKGKRRIPRAKRRRLRRLRIKRKRRLRRLRRIKRLRKKEKKMCYLYRKRLIRAEKSILKFPKYLRYFVSSDKRKKTIPKVTIFKQLNNGFYKKKTRGLLIPNRKKYLFYRMRKQRRYRISRRRKYYFIKRHKRRRRFLKRLYKNLKKTRATNRKNKTSTIRKISSKKAHKRRKRLYLRKRKVLYKKKFFRLLEKRYNKIQRKKRKLFKAFKRKLFKKSFKKIPTRINKRLLQTNRNRDKVPAPKIKPYAIKKFLTKKAKIKRNFIHKHFRLKKSNIAFLKKISYKSNTKLGTTFRFNSLRISVNPKTKTFIKGLHKSIKSKDSFSLLEKAKLILSKFTFRLRKFFYNIPRKTKIIFNKNKSKHFFYLGKATQDKIKISAQKDAQKTYDLFERNFWDNKYKNFKKHPSYKRNKRKIQTQKANKKYYKQKVKNIKKKKKLNNIKKSIKFQKKYTKNDITSYKYSHRQSIKRDNKNHTIMLLKKKPLKAIKTTLPIKGILFLRKNRIFKILRINRYKRVIRRKFKRYIRKNTTRRKLRRKYKKYRNFRFNIYSKNVLQKLNVRALIRKAKLSLQLRKKRRRIKKKQLERYKRKAIQSKKITPRKRKFRRKKTQFEKRIFPKIKKKMKEIKSIVVRRYKARKKRKFDRIPMKLLYGKTRLQRRNRGSKIKRIFAMRKAYGYKRKRLHSKKKLFVLTNRRFRKKYIMKIKLAKRFSKKYKKLKKSSLWTKKTLPKIKRKRRHIYRILRLFQQFNKLFSPRYYLYLARKERIIDLFNTAVTAHTPKTNKGIISKIYYANTKPLNYNKKKTYLTQPIEYTI